MKPSSLPEVHSSASVTRNIGWSAAAQGWSLLLTLGSGIILARLLTPADYGVLAVVAPLIGFAHQFQSLGFSNAIIQARSIDQRQLDALFWLSLGLSLLIAAAIALSAPLVGYLLRDSRVPGVLTVASISIVAVALSAQPTAILSRNLRFRAIAVRNIFSVTLGTLASVAIAAATHSYWALIAGMVLVPVVNFATSATVVRWRPGLPRRGANAESLVRFGLNLWGANLFSFASRNMDNLIVAYKTSAQELGLYNRAYSLLLYPINQAVAPLAQIMISMLSRSIDDPDRYRTLYWRSVMLLLLLCQPFLVIAIVFPETVIGLLLGPRWLPAAPMFGWFGAAGLFQMFLGTTNWLLMSQGRGHEYMRVMLVTSIVALLSFLAGMHWGARGIATAYVLGQGLVCLPWQLWIVGRTNHVRHRELFERLAPHLAALAIVIALVMFSRWQFGSPRWPLLIADVTMAYSAYAIVLFINVRLYETLQQMRTS